MNIGKSVGFIVIVFGLVVSGVAWGDRDRGGRGEGCSSERGGHHGEGGMMMGGGMPKRLCGMIKSLPKEKREAAFKLVRLHRESTLELRQRMMNGRFEMMKLAQRDVWDEEAAKVQATAMSESKINMMVKRAKLQYDVRQLMDKVVVDP